MGKFVEDHFGAANRRRLHGWNTHSTLQPVTNGKHIAKNGDFFLTVVFFGVLEGVVLNSVPLNGIEDFNTNKHDAWFMSSDSGWTSDKGGILAARLFELSVGVSKDLVLSVYVCVASTVSQ